MEADFMEIQEKVREEDRCHARSASVSGVQGRMGEERIGAVRGGAVMETANIQSPQPIPRKQAAW